MKTKSFNLSKASYLLFLFFSFVLLFTACNGEDDTVYDRSDYLGNWEVTEKVSGISGETTYTVNIKTDPSNSSQVLVYNLYFIGNDIAVKALITNDIITIDQQFLPDCNFTFEGSGKLVTENFITMDYSVSDGADLFQVDAELRNN